MIRVAVLGCTGSIGSTTIRILRRYKNDFSVVLLANATRVDELLALKKEFSVPNVYSECGLLIKNDKQIDFDPDYLNKPETYFNVDIVVNGIVGLAGLRPTVAVMEAGKILASANKESFVCAGEYLRNRFSDFSKLVRPVDSEHSSLWQCLDGKEENVKRLIITASGGAFRDYDRQKLSTARAVDALQHPNWDMGKKVTVDCATLVNKGLEIIEAKRLFGIDDVQAVINRESIVHAMVQMKDNSYICGLSIPDMEIPIQYALFYPERKNTSIRELDFTKAASLNFQPIDKERFPCFELCVKASEQGDYLCTVLNAADEALTYLYLREEIGFYDISDYISDAFEKFGYNNSINALEDIFILSNTVKEYIYKSTKR